MELGRDKAGLPFHDYGVVGPCIEKELLLGGIQRDQVSEHFRRGINIELTVNRESLIQWLKMVIWTSVSLCRQLGEGRSGHQRRLVRLEDGLQPLRLGAHSVSTALVVSATRPRRVLVSNGTGPLARARPR